MLWNTVGPYGRRDLGPISGVASIARSGIVKDASSRCFRHREFLKGTPCGFGGKWTAARTQPALSNIPHARKKQ